MLRALTLACVWAKSSHIKHFLFYNISYTSFLLGKYYKSVDYLMSWNTILKVRDRMAVRVSVVDPRDCAADQELQLIALAPRHH